MSLLFIIALCFGGVLVAYLLLALLIGGPTLLLQRLFRRRR